MAQTSRDEFGDYLKRLGEHINLIYARLKKIEAKIDDVSREIADIKESASVDRKGFNDFVNRLTESLKELLPPLPEETTEAVAQPPQEKTESTSTDQGTL